MIGYLFKAIFLTGAIAIALLASCACDKAPAEEPEAEPPTLETTAPIVEEPEPDFYTYEIVDKRAVKTPFTGKYAYMHIEDQWFELFEDHAVVSSALAKGDGVLELEEIEGMIWLRFSGAELERCLANRLLSAGGDTIAVELEATVGSGWSEAFFEVKEIQEATEAEMELLYFDSETFYLGKAFGEIEDMYPDLEFEYQLAGGDYYYSEQADMYFVFPGWYPDGEERNIETVAFGARAIEMFPNMGARVFKAEVERIIGREILSGRYEYEAPQVLMGLQGYSFSYDVTDSLDILPDTMVFVRGPYNE